MVYRLTWLPGVLKQAGLKVAEVDGWESRGHGDAGDTVGVICHHTAGPAQGNMPSLGTLVDGRSDLPGPLAQLGLGRDGTFYVVAAGKCYHAGAGRWLGVETGNTSFIGIEAENPGDGGVQWPNVQLDAYKRGAAAILKHVGRTANWCVGHKEFALPPGRKTDPDFDMATFRDGVAAILDGTAPAPTLIPAFAPPASAGGPTRATLRRGMAGDFVKQLQEKIGTEVDGYFGPKTEAQLRVFQRDHDLVPDGIAGPKTWAVIDQPLLN